MISLALAMPVVAGGLLLLPAMVWAATAVFLRDAPSDWGAAALLAWSALGAGLLAGSCLQAAPGPLPWIAAAIAFVALMVGGPPGLAAVCVALVLLALPASELPAPRWLPLALAALAALAAGRTYLG